MTFTWYWDIDQSFSSELKYFTEWGKYMTLFTFNLLVMGHIWYEPEDASSVKLGMWWKWCSWFYALCFWWEIIITFVFWAFLLPTTNFGDVFAGHPWGEFKLMTDHIFPCFFLLVDWLLNGIVYEKNQLWPNLGPCIVYFFWNLIVVKISGDPVYPGMTWNSFLSVLLPIMAFPFAICLWYLLCWCTNKKLTRVLRRNGIIESSASGTFDSLVNA